MNDVLFYSFALLVAGYIFRIWLSDLRAYRHHNGRATHPTGSPDAADKNASAPSPPPTFPGATPVGIIALVVAVVGALVLLAVETGGEYALGVDQQQTKMTVLFGLYTLAAAFVEELIFRGYLIYERGSKAQLILGIVLVSVVFAGLHPYLWQWKMPEGAGSWEIWRGSLSVDLGSKALFSTSVVFVRSLWFYCVRFWPANPLRSLLPCIAAHLATNLGVLTLKAVQGHVAGLY